MVIDPDLPACSILLSSHEERLVETRKVVPIHRELTPHWEGQLRKHQDRKSIRTVEGLPVPLGYAKLVANHPEKTFQDRHGRVRPVPVKRGTWAIMDISDDSRHPETGDTCWVVVIRRLV